MRTAAALFGSTVESGASAVSAGFAYVLPRRRKSTSSNKTESLLPQLDRRLERDPFEGEYRKRALQDPNRALETLQPYAHLDLCVVCAKDLVPKDETVIFSGTDDPYVEVWLNDVKQGTSEWRLWSTNPRWDYNISLDMYSPMSIIHLRVLDRDTFSKHDLVGFVEFRVADLQPNEETVGWFELRHNIHLIHTADKRLLQHERCRDDERVKVHQRDKDRGSKKKTKKTTPTDEVDKDRGSEKPREKTTPIVEETPFPRPIPAVQEQCKPRALSAGAIGTRRSRRCIPICRGSAPKENTDSDILASYEQSRQSLQQEKQAVVYRRLTSDESIGRNGDDDADEKTKHSNAGEVFVKMKLRISGHLDEGQIADQEFYAFCMPQPNFLRFAEKDQGDSGDADYWHNRTLDFPEIYDDLDQIKYMLVDVILMRTFCVVGYLLTWRCFPLTLGLGIWWVAFCIKTTELLWTLPAWVALLFWLLRKDDWRMVMVAHEKYSALSDEGYAVIASLADSNKMNVWLGRLIISLQGTVKSVHRDEQRKLAEVIFRDRKPMMSFDELVDMLQTQRWIEWNKHKQQCPKSHTLSYLGNTPNQKWKCMKEKGCCHHIKKHNSANVGRYHCRACEFDICEYCVVSTTHIPTLVGLPQSFMPSSMVELFKAAEFPAHDTRTFLRLFLYRANHMFSHTEKGKLRSANFYKGCAYASAVLVVLPWAMQTLIGTLCDYAWKTFCIGLGSIILLARHHHIQVCLRYIHAWSQLHKYQHRRSTGGPAEYWEFFLPSSEPPAKAPRSPRSSRTRGKLLDVD